MGLSRQELQQLKASGFNLEKESVNVDSLGLLDEIIAETEAKSVMTDLVQSEAASQSAADEELNREIERLKAANFTFKVKRPRRKSIWDDGWDVEATPYVTPVDDEPIIDYAVDEAAKTDLDRKAAYDAMIGRLRSAAKPQFKTSRGRRVCAGCGLEGCTIGPFIYK